MKNAYEARNALLQTRRISANISTPIKIEFPAGFGKWFYSNEKLTEQLSYMWQENREEIIANVNTFLTEQQNTMTYDKQIQNRPCMYNTAKKVSTIFFVIVRWRWKLNTVSKFQYDITQFIRCDKENNIGVGTWYKNDELTRKLQRCSPCEIDSVWCLADGWVNYVGFRRTRKFTANKISFSPLYKENPPWKHNVIN